MSWAAVAVGVIGAGASIYGSKKAAKAAQPTQDQKAIETQTLSNMKTAAPIGTGLLQGGQANLKVFNDFYHKLATGDRAGALALLAPQLRMADQQHMAGLGSELGLAPRSGGSAEGRLAGMDALKGQREDAILGLRTNAVNTLGALGGDQISMGSGLLGAANSSGLAMYGAMQNQRNNAFDQSRMAGQSAFELMKYIGSAGKSVWDHYKTGQNNKMISQFAPGGTATSGSIW